MSLFGSRESSPPSHRRRSSLSFGQSKPAMSFGFFEDQSDDTRRDSLVLPQPTLAGVDWSRRRSSGLGFWLDLVEEEKSEGDFPPPSVLTKKSGNSPTRKRRKIEDFSAYGKLKLGDIRRKQLKTAISETCRKNPEARDRVLTIGKLKEAAIGDLFRMAEACGLLDYALDLVDDRLAKKKAH